MATYSYKGRSAEGRLVTGAAQGESIEQVAQHSYLRSNFIHGIVLVGAPGRLSLVFEMRSEPRQVTARRADDSEPPGSVASKTSLAAGDFS